MNVMELKNSEAMEILLNYSSTMDVITEKERNNQSFMNS
jgi:hypothetical protein